MRTPIVVAAAAALLALVASPAVAETWEAPDRRADVRATPIRLDVPSRADDCDGPRDRRVRNDRRRDILKLSVDHQAEAVVLTLSMRDVARRDAGTTYALHVRTPKEAYSLDVTRYSPGGDLEVFFAQEPDYPSPSEIKDCSFTIVSTGLPCEGLVADAGTRLDIVTVTLPRSCLRLPRWVRVGAEVHGYSRQTEPGHFTVFSDAWTRRGERPHGFLPPFGPRVHAG